MSWFSLILCPINKYNPVGLIVIIVFAFLIGLLKQETIKKETVKLDIIHNATYNILKQNQKVGYLVQILKGFIANEIKILFEVNIG